MNLINFYKLVMKNGDKKEKKSRKKQKKELDIIIN